MVKTFPEELKGKVLTPAAANLFERGPGGLLVKEKREIFHTITAKALFISKRSRPDIALATSVLSTRVREPTKDD